uniref:glutamate--tRNA ligase n=1 Tax=Pararhizobium sp. IMCC3301 TaxID=3067904 RepID=UPI00274179EB|nr:glutamate--tRNA ligase [Pararhizobium sp. IMCC3301]
MTNPIVRFAPSPTGRIHIGNARTALYNWLFARQHGGSFILRFDDTDKARSKEEFATGILADMAWLGIEPARVERQSARFADYQLVTEELKAKGLLYPCYESEDELERRRARRRARGLPPIYDRSALELSDGQRQKLEAEGKQPHWRFLLPNYKDDVLSIERTEIHWDDVFRGPQTVDLGSMSDPVLVREDGSWLYTLPSIIDDAAFGISHVIRGADHITNTGAQIAIFRALGYIPPAFGHHNLLTGSEGEGLSKRLGSLSLQGLREAGFEAMAVASLASLIGTSDAVEPIPDMAGLAQRFDPQKVSKSPARFNVAELDALNAKLLHGLSYDAVADRLTVPDGVDGALFWDAISGNLEKLPDADRWAEIVRSGAKPLIDDEDRDMVSKAVGLLPQDPWSQSTWMDWANAVKSETGRKGRALFMPLRKAVTGSESGPEMTKLLPLIGRKTVLARLS